MAMVQGNGEHEKGTKKTFAPPTQKSHSVKPQPKPWKEDSPGARSPEVEAKPSQLSASLEKKEQKAATENGPGRGREKKRKAHDKPAEKRGKEKTTLTNAEFEEIFQTVLQKSLQECLGSGLNFAETSCVQRTIPTKADKEPGIAPSTTDNENADGEKEIVPASSPEEEVNSEIRTSELGQPATKPSKKKCNRLCLSKRKKKAENEKMEKIQDGHECTLRDKQKTMIQDHSQIKGQQKEEEGGFGHCLIWVQCSFPKCEKWRQLRGNIDPSVLPDNWSCDQNPDLNYNRCDIPEETWTGRESDVAYASYVPGSIVWAKQYGYPWWPGMIESDPDLGEYFLFASHLDSLPKKGRNKDYNQKLEAAITMAHKAEQISVQERVNLFGFWSRYSRADISEEGQDLRLSESNSPESCLEKDERDSEEEEEEKEEKEDPTLPRPKPAKLQTKKTKSRDPAGRGDGTPKKPVKNSPSSEAPEPPVPMLRGKEAQASSDLDRPGPKKKFKAPESKAPATNLSEEKEVKIVSKCPIPAARHGVSPWGKEGPGRHVPLTQEATSFLREDDGSSDLDLEQLLDDIGEPDEGGELLRRGSSEESLAALFEE
ncbi:zinc finger CW-type PWWP domain protein 1 isoform X3 [Meriones unguiculatus]|uniref:zinc finger CW-type PWWP domain protein 1 isoform X3 n=1 Tax=Meriones unguiculatus TaxID=10047 RepID=UPI00293E06F6|nr:zinc finger CW-type PWWP domain protein 1 isoform X3 [Meriones unguiculatus]